MEYVRQLCVLPCIVFLAVLGIYFTYKLNFIQIFGLKSFFSKSKSKESFTAFATALGGTVGVGSITGIGISISEGGLGSIFWMWISSFFCMCIKYAETFISVKYKDPFLGGAMVTLKKSGYKKLGAFFAIIALVTSFGGGNAAQSGAMSEAFSDIGVSPYMTAIFSSVILFAVLFGGRKRIEKVNSIIVPLATVLYVLGMLFILFKSFENIPSVTARIVKEALGFKQMGTGVSAFLFSRALRTGTLRGVFSHEAGMGSSPIAHSRVENACPEESGLFGIAEIYIDTFIVGTLTAYALSCNNSFSVSKLFLTYFGKGGGILFSLFVAVFAFSALFSWCYYSEACLDFLFKSKERMFFIYKILAVSIFSLGCIMPIEPLWQASDVLNCIMTYPNLFLIFIKRKEIIGVGRTKKQKILGNV